MPKLEDEAAQHTSALGPLIGLTREDVFGAVAVMLREAVALDGPVTLRFPKGAAISRDGTGEGLAARQLREGDDLVLVGVGDRVESTLEAADLLAEEGLEAAVWDLRSVRPVDPSLVAALADAPFVVTVENGVVSGGAGAYLSDRLVERTGVRSAPPILRLGVPDGYIPHGKPDQILTELGLDGPGIAAATRKAITDR